ncbi:MAG: Holliday junction branch migration protein RuvA [Proteobacteria bacterium]|nr:Holliday junction branch migration protein RuvA [Pseudomonadota bacterium]
MIAKLWGRLDDILDDAVVVDVQGVGYHAFCSGRTLRRLPAAGAAVELHIVTHVREDHIHLYGFIDAIERDWFGLLQTVQGVGARVALALLAVIEPKDLLVVIAAQDKAALMQANGVGGKLATRILTELKDAAGSVNLGPAALAVEAGAGGDVGDAVSALVNLGYRRGEAAVAVASAARGLGDGAGLQDLIRASLGELST